MPIGGPSFSSVRKARELLRERSLDIYNAYVKLAEEATKKGDFETAEKIYRYILDHTEDEDGKALFAPSVDKQQKLTDGDGPKGPTINIGVAIGGLGKALPEPVIEAVQILPAGKDDESE
jgi:hypothetical protein